MEQFGQTRIKDIPQACTKLKKGEKISNIGERNISTLIGKILALCVCSVFIFGTASILADPFIFIDDFADSVMWDLDTESFSGFACETDSLGRMYITKWGTCGQGWRGMEIPLCREIGTNENFSISFKIMALSDISEICSTIRFIS